MNGWIDDREIDGKYKCMGNTVYKQLLLLEYRDKKDLCSGRIKESFFEKVKLTLEGFRKQKRGRGFIRKWFAVEGSDDKS